MQFLASEPLAKELSNSLTPYICRFTRFSMYVTIQSHYLC
nr:MAG TPA: hypothetical protein [Caudoviricetes sp.]